MEYDAADLPKVPRDPKLDKPPMPEYDRAAEALRYARLLVNKRVIKPGKR